MHLLFLRLEDGFHHAGEPGRHVGFNLIGRIMAVFVWHGAVALHALNVATLVGARRGEDVDALEAGLGHAAVNHAARMARRRRRPPYALPDRR